MCIMFSLIIHGNVPTIVVKQTVKAHHHEPLICLYKHLEHSPKELYTSPRATIKVCSQALSKQIIIDV